MTEHIFIQKGVKLAGADEMRIAIGSAEDQDRHAGVHGANALSEPDGFLQTGAEHNRLSLTGTLPHMSDQLVRAVDQRDGVIVV
jgi:hypothetical protein